MSLVSRLGDEVDFPEENFLFGVIFCSVSPKKQ